MKKRNMIKQKYIELAKNVDVNREKQTKSWMVLNYWLRRKSTRHTWNHRDQWASSEASQSWCRDYIASGALQKVSINHKHQPDYTKDHTANPALGKRLCLMYPSDIEVYLLSQFCCVESKGRSTNIRSLISRHQGVSGTRRTSVE